MPVKPWICWKAPKRKSVPAELPSKDHVKPLLQLKALKTKCHQRQVAVRQCQELLKTMQQRARAAQAELSQLCAKDAPAEKVSESREEGQIENPSQKVGADFWKAEASRLATALQERRKLNDCLRYEARPS